MKLSSQGDNRLPEFHEDREFGTWLHERLVASYGLETRATRIACIQSAQDRLQARRFPSARKKAEILAMPGPAAFAAPGDYVYISRDLLTQLPTEDAAAFVIAHELAHHELGHCHVFHDHVLWRQLPQSTLIDILLNAARKMLNSPENERDADAHALDLCLEAGYDPPKCLVVFDVLAGILRRHHRGEMVVGPRPKADALPEDVITVWKAEWDRWAWEHATGYPPIRERKAALEARLKSRILPAGTAYAALGQHCQRHPTPSRTALQIRMDHVDQALATWHTHLTTAASNVAALVRVPAFMRLMGGDGNPAPAPVTGVTQARVVPALNAIKTIRLRLRQLLEMLDHAEDLRAKIDPHNPSLTQLQELEHQLLGDSIPLERIFVSLEKRGLFSAHEQVVSISAYQLLEQLVQEFEGPRDIIFAVETAWERWDPERNALETWLRQLQEHRESFGIEGLPPQSEVESQVRELCALMRTDPLGVSESQVTLLKPQLASLQAQWEQLAHSHRQTDAGLRRARQLLHRLCASNSATPSDTADPARAASLPCAPDAALTDLIQWLEVLESAWAEGRRQAVRVGLDRWLKAAHHHLDRKEQEIGGHTRAGQS